MPQQFMYGVDVGMEYLKVLDLGLVVAEVV